ncbi:MAG: 3,4-dioxygenase subunit beta [Nocardioides sp.]|uniref:dioxygenase family protein n=1 Tax=Nocardioides sp. TaxID=35761 RepID=UPI0023A70E33|nr:3,4-dioxygenase subunit beta [Nocardioides sp.]MDE0777398.1 3,4-dioxygenase subunit beta [Nocardioides sp.]
MTNPAEHDHDGPHEHDLGLSHDLPKIVERERRSLGRRGLLGLFGGLGAVAVVGCATDSGTATSSTVSDPASANAGGPGGTAVNGGPPDGGGGPGGDAGSSVEVADGEIPEETAGPYPGDGSNGVNVLSESGIVRSDLRQSFGSASGVAQGVTTTVRLKVYDLNGTEATALSGAAVYLWHCDRAGNYSLYSEAAIDENYLRGVQETDADGNVEFTTIFPAAYAGRWPHMHFEVYPSLAEATSAANKLRTSQLALPEDVCNEVYASAEGYDASVANMQQTPLEGDNVFSDGYSLQMASVTGSVDDGYVVTLNVPV